MSKRQATIISDGTAQGTSIRVDGEILKGINTASYSLKSYGDGHKLFTFIAHLRAPAGRPEPSIFKEVE